MLRLRRHDKSRRITFGTVTVDQTCAAASAEIVPRAPCIEESALVAAHAARPFGCRMRRPFRAAASVPPLRHHAGRLRRPTLRT